MPISGNTIRLYAEFFDFDGTKVVPENIVVRFYNRNRERIGEDISVVPVEEQIYYDLVTENPEIRFYEFYGEVNGQPVVERAMLEIQWMRGR